MNEDKPHYGNLTNWYKLPCPTTGGLGYRIVCYFEDHPWFKGMTGMTSEVYVFGDNSREIETKNSRYTLIGEGIK